MQTNDWTCQLGFLVEILLTVAVNFVANKHVCWHSWPLLLLHPTYPQPNRETGLISRNCVVNHMTLCSVPTAPVLPTAFRGNVPVDGFHPFRTKL